MLELRVQAFAAPVAEPAAVAGLWVAAPGWISLMQQAD
jgi:hypothetical protein